MQRLIPPVMVLAILALLHPVAQAELEGDVPTPCVSDTKFSVDREHFTEPFQLEITSATDGATIRYTTDGSVPSLFGGQTYKEPITIERLSFARWPRSRA